jgi:excisionase family DNA binding protein
MSTTTAAPTSLLDIRQAADALGVSERWMRRAVQNRALRFYRVGGLLRFREADLNAYVDANASEPIAR